MINRLEGITYPQKDDAHMITVKSKTKRVFDEHYHYRNRNIFFRFFRFLVSLVAMIIGRLLVAILIGARVKGRKNYTKNKKLYKNGLVTVCNHIHMWDSIVIMGALRYRFINYPAWEENMRGGNRHLIRLTGGIVVPQSSMRGLPKMRQAFDEILHEGKIVHFFPEGSMWWYNKPMRTFKKGAFELAVRNNTPILPMAFTYRPARGIYRLFGRKDPLLTLNIGEPILPPKAEDIPDLADRINYFRNEVWAACQKMTEIPTNKHYLEKNKSA